MTKTIKPSLENSVKSSKSSVTRKNVRKIIDNEGIFFDIPICVRMNSDMLRVIDFWIDNPKCIDVVTNRGLFDNRSHFVKVAVLELFKQLRNTYQEHPVL